MSSNVKFTVIIPTRARPDTLFHCLRALLEQDYDNVTFIVSDNFSQDNTRDVVEGFKDARVMYLNTGKRISMSHNWEFALSHVESGWVMFVGDDDGLLPGALTTLSHVILESNCQALTTACCSFKWPDHFSSCQNGELSIPLISDRLYTVKNSQNMLAKVMNGRAEYNDLPWLYNGGAASVDLINKLRNSDKSFFRSICPDIYSAIALCLGTTNYAFVHVPVAINGASKHSGGTSYSSNEKNVKGSPTHKFLSEANIPFHESLVLGRSINMLVYECYLQAKHLYKLPEFFLNSQLEIMLAASPKSIRKDIIADCFQIAMLNDVSMPSSIRVFIKRMRLLISAAVVRIYSRPSITISAKALSVADVYDAGKAAAHIYELFESIVKRSYISRVTTRLFLFTIGFGRYLKRILER